MKNTKKNTKLKGLNEQEIALIMRYRALKTNQRDSEKQLRLEQKEMSNKLLNDVTEAFSKMLNLKDFSKRFPLFTIYEFGEDDHNKKVYDFHAANFIYKGICKTYIVDRFLHHGMMNCTTSDLALSAIRSNDFIVPDPYNIYFTDNSALKKYGVGFKTKEGKLLPLGDLYTYKNKVFSVILSNQYGSLTFSISDSTFPYYNTNLKEVDFIKEALGLRTTHIKNRMTFFKNKEKKLTQLIADRKLELSQTKNDIKKLKLDLADFAGVSI